MKTHTSKSAIWLRSLVLLPLLTVLIYGFSEKVIIQQDKATSEQLAEYNKIAKLYNAMPKEKMVVKLKEVERIRYIYDLMSLEQRRNAAPFPNFPPPPPLPAPKRVYKGQELDNVPPPPPSSPNPLDHIIELAKKGATFYNEGNKISSDKAIAIIKKNKSINIQVLDHDSKNPIVKLSKKPIVVEGRLKKN